MPKINQSKIVPAVSRLSKYLLDIVWTKFSDFFFRRKTSHFILSMIMSLGASVSLNF
jgi:hypothetical protein